MCLYQYQMNSITRRFQCTTEIVLAFIFLGEDVLRFTALGEQGRAKCTSALSVTIACCCDTCLRALQWMPHLLVPLLDSLPESHSCRCLRAPPFLNGSMLHVHGSMYEINMAFLGHLCVHHVIALPLSIVAGHLCLSCTAKIAIYASQHH